MKKILTGMATGAVLTFTLINWNGAEILERTGEIVNQLVTRIGILEDQLHGTDDEIGVIESDNHHRGQVILANQDANQLRQNVIDAIADIDGIYWGDVPAAEVGE